MKFLNNNKIKNNFLGFSHSSPNMEVPSTISTNLPNSAIFDGVLGRSNNEVFSHLSTMPLESDGSLCMMEGFSRSQAGLESSSTSSPKLEDFLGGSSMDTPVHYGSNDRETLASHQQIEFETSPTGSFNFFQQNPYFFSGLVGNEMYMTPLEEANRETHLQNFSLQLPPVSEYGFQSLRNWVGMKSPTDHSVEQRMAWFFGDGGRHDSLGAMSYGDLQSLNLSTGTESVAVATKKRGFGNVGKKESAHRKSVDTFGQRTSQYRGVTKHRWTGRFEAHLWDNSCKKEGQTRKGRQVYLGGYDMEEKAARAYDLAALKYWGTSTYINLSLEDYKEELEQMKNMNRQEYVAYLRRKSSGFSRGASIYRGVTRHHQHGRWQARIGRIAGSKDLYLGTFGTQEEAAEAYDIAAIKFRGVNAVTNFEITRYDVELIRESNVILNGELAKRNKPTNDGPVVNHPIGSLRDDNGIGGLNSIVVIDDDQNSLEKTIKINKLPNHESVQEGVEVSVMTSLGGSRKNPLSQGLLPQ